METLFFVNIENYILELFCGKDHLLAAAFYALICQYIIIKWTNGRKENLKSIPNTSLLFLSLFFNLKYMSINSFNKNIYYGEIYIIKQE